MVSLLPLRSVREQTHLLTGGMWGPNIAVGSDNRDRSDVKRLVQVRAFALPAIPVFCFFFRCFALLLFFFFFPPSPPFLFLLFVFSLIDFHYFKVETWILGEILIFINILIYNSSIFSNVIRKETNLTKKE